MDRQTVTTKVNIDTYFGVLQRKVPSHIDQSMVVVDEAHNFRNTDSELVKKLFKLTVNAKIVILLTATPI